MPNSPDAYFDATAGGRLPNPDPAAFVGPPEPPPQILGRDQTLQSPAALAANPQDDLKSGWLTAFEKIKADPDLQRTLIQMGAQLLQPRDVRQSTAGAIGAALAGGVETYANLTSGRAKEKRSIEKDTRDEQFRSDTLSQGTERLNLQKEANRNLADTRSATLSAAEKDRLIAVRQQVMKELNSRRENDQVLLDSGAITVQAFNEVWNDENFQDMRELGISQRLGEASAELQSTYTPPESAEKAWEMVLAKNPDAKIKNSPEYKAGLARVKGMFPEWEGPVFGALEKIQLRNSEQKAQKAKSDVTLDDTKAFNRINRGTITSKDGIPTKFTTMSDEQLQEMKATLIRIDRAGNLPKRRQKRLEELLSSVIKQLGE